MSEDKLMIVGERGVAISTMADAMSFCEQISRSGFAPAYLDTPAKVFVALQTGLELGFSPMQSLRLVYPVNGRAGLMGEGMLALLRRRGHEISVGVEKGKTAEDVYGWCKFRRADTGQAGEERFTYAEAIKAGLTAKKGAWQTDIKAMLIWRAVGRVCRWYFSDVISGVDVEGAEAPEREPDTSPDPLLAAAAPAPQIADPPDPLLAQLQASVVRSEPEQEVAEEQETAAPHKPASAFTVLAVTSNKGETKGRAWERFDIQVVNGDGQARTLSTFSVTDADVARTCLGSGERVLLETKAGKYGEELTAIYPKSQVPF